MKGKKAYIIMFSHLCLVIIAFLFSKGERI